jgi:hypothetical protein
VGALIAGLAAVSLPGALAVGYTATTFGGLWLTVMICWSAESWEEACDTIIGCSRMSSWVITGAAPRWEQQQRRNEQRQRRLQHVILGDMREQVRAPRHHGRRGPHRHLPPALPGAADGKEDAPSVVTSVPSVSVCWATIIKFSACG